MWLCGHLDTKNTELNFSVFCKFHLLAGFSMRDSVEEKISLVIFVELKLKR